MSTEDILNFHRVDERIITGGQPTEAQLAAAAEEGVQVVINLATLDPRYSLDDEGGLVSGLGLEYHHIPVDWEKPLESDFEAFAGLMRQAGAKRVLIHCAANYRVTAFYALYGMRALGWSEDQADRFRAVIWRTRQYPIWDEYIHRMKAKITAHA